MSEEERRDFATELPDSKGSRVSPARQTAAAAAAENRREKGRRRPRRRREGAREEEKERRAEGLGMEGRAGGRRISVAESPPTDVTELIHCRVSAYGIELF